MLSLPHLMLLKSCLKAVFCEQSVFLPLNSVSSVSNGLLRCSLQERIGKEKSANSYGHQAGHNPAWRPCSPPQENSVMERPAGLEPAI